MFVVQSVHPSEVFVNRLANILTTAIETIRQPKIGLGIGLAVSTLAGAPMPLPQLALAGPWIAACAMGMVGARVAASVGLASFLLFGHPGMFETVAAVAISLLAAWGIPALMERSNDLPAEQNAFDNGACAIVVNCEGFSSLDDSYGIGTSDYVFKMLHRALKMETRSSDLLVHAQNQELILVLDGPSPEIARTVMERVERRFAGWLADAGYECNLSVGLANMDEHDDDFDALMRATRHPKGNPYLD